MALWLGHDLLSGGFPGELLGPDDMNIKSICGNNGGMSITTHLKGFFLKHTKYLGLNQTVFGLPLVQICLHTLTPLTHSHNQHSKPVTQSKILLACQVLLTLLVIPSSNSSLFLSPPPFSFHGYFGFAHQHFGSISFRRPSQTSIFLLKCSVCSALGPSSISNMVPAW